jgi:hypothetical protein
MAFENPAKFGAALFVALTAFASTTNAAELPVRAKQPAANADTKSRSCEIDGEKGILLPGSDTCIRVYGSLSAQVSGGSLSRSR